eukprot:259512_1
MANMFNNNNSYNSGPSQFSGSQIGGGYVSNENFNSSNKPIQPKIPFDQRKLSQVTIKQIVSAPPPQPEEYLLIDGQEISQLVMVAQIESIDIQSAHTTYNVTDYTGSLEAKQWSNDNNPQQKQLNLREGTWVRLVGRINHFNGRCSINLFNIAPVTDFNEITHHFVEVIYGHLLNTTAKVRSVAPQNNDNGNNNMNKNNNQNQWNNNQPQSFGNNNNFGNNNQNQYGHLPQIQNKILQIINTPEMERSDAGCNVELLFQRLSNEDVNAIRGAIDDLSSAGLIYSTVDDDHYKYSGDQ